MEQADHRQRLRVNSDDMVRCSLVFLALLARAQTPSDSNTVIRASTRLVQVNVIVHDKNGPVSNLTKSDFVLLERGKPRAIDFFSIESTVGTGKIGGPALFNTFSNRKSLAGQAPPNATIVLLDGLNTRFEDQAHAKQQLIKFLNSVDPKDRIAIYTLGKTLKVLCDFTDSPEVLLKTLAKLRGTTGADVITAEPDAANTGDPRLDEFIDQSNKTFAAGANFDRARFTFSAFAAIAGHVADLPGRKTLIWVTGSLPFSLASAAKTFNRANLAVYPVDARGLVGMPGQLTAAAPSPNSRRPHEIPSFGAEGLQTLQELADLTGGRAFYNTNDLSGALRTALDDAAVTYTLGFYQDADALDGKFHELKVQVTRPGLNVRHRKGYLAVKEAVASDELNKSNLLDALDSPLESASLALSARAELAMKNLKITWSLDIHDLQLTHQGGTASGSINVVFAQKDEAGKVLDMTQEAYDLHLKKEDYETYLRTGMAFHNSLVLKAGAKTLRIVVADRTNAAIGSLIVPLPRVK
jgi:VWFA-related protein